jgi:putative phage-type endonuclease
MNLDKVRTAKKIGDFTPSDPEWHELRTKGITGTDTGAILGVSPFASAYKVWAVKTGQVSDEVKQNERMRLGQLLEAPLIQLYREKHEDVTVYENVGTYIHEDYPELIANPDGLVTIGEKLYILEVKTSRKYWSEVPAHYRTQVLHYADVFSADGVIVISLAGGDYQEWEVEVDENELSMQRSIVLEFWQENVINGVEPDWDGSQSTYETVRSISSVSEEGETDLGYLGVQLYNALNKFNEADKEFRQLKSATLAQMQEAKYGYAEGYLVAVKRQRGEGKPYLEVKGR